MVQVLLEKRVTTETFDDRGRTPLYLATYHGHVAAALALLDAGADVNIPCGPLRSQ